MKKVLFLITLTVLTLIAVTVCATDDCHSSSSSKNAEENPTAQVAVYTIPSMTEEVAVKISQVLKDNKGISIAKPDFEKKQMTIIFSSEVTDQNKIKDSLVSVVPETKLDSVRKAEEKDLKHNCGNCPSRKTCNKAKS